MYDAIANCFVVRSSCRPRMLFANCEAFSVQRHAMLAKEFPERSPILSCGPRGMCDVTFVAVEYFLEIIALEIFDYASLQGTKRFVAGLLRQIR